MTTNVAVLHYPEKALAYQAISDLRTAPFAGDVLGAAIVQRNQDGTLSIPDATDADAGSGFTRGSLIGLVVGVLGGPLGMLFGWSVGALAGTVADANKAGTQTSALLSFAQQLPPGDNVLMLEIDENHPAALDEFAAKLGGTVVRRPLSEVLDEVEAQEAAAEAAQQAAEDKLKAEHKEERRADREERIAKLKGKLHL